MDTCDRPDIEAVLASGLLSPTVSDSERRLLRLCARGDVTENRTPSLLDEAVSRFLFFEKDRVCSSVFSTMAFSTVNVVEF